MDIKFEKMSSDDAQDVIDIFNYYIENSFAAFLEEKLPYAFFGKFLEMTEGYPAYTIKTAKDSQTVGFCFLRAYHPLPTFKETCEITYFIAPEFTNKGVGKKALQLLEAEAKKMGISNILAAISSYNDKSIEFHRLNGFDECGRFERVGKKMNKYFDVVWMQKKLL